MDRCAAPLSGELLLGAAGSAVHRVSARAKGEGGREGDGEVVGQVTGRWLARERRGPVGAERGRDK